ncbi:hypothetical protein PCURB6_32380 [Paenibacillus curdlanolyticus]|nr:hypothetical protein PCURB6_32380 [Paenibacillus curdlanolyticus]
MARPVLPGRLVEMDFQDLLDRLGQQVRLGTWGPQDLQEQRVLQAQPELALWVRPVPLAQPVRLDLAVEIQEQLVRLELPVRLELRALRVPLAKLE